MAMSYNAMIGLALEDLEIALPARISHPGALLRRCLQLTPNIEALVLTLPVTTPKSLLNNVKFPNIRLFSTNLPHHTLIKFLSNHPTIVTIVLGQCGRTSDCALRSVDLHRVTELQCPSHCLSGIARGQVSVANITLASSVHAAINALASSPLFSLVIEFYSNDYDILERITRAAPRLTRLKLIEKPCTHVREILSLLQVTYFNMT